MTAAAMDRLRAVGSLSPSRRVVAWAAAVVALLVAVALVAVADFPTGERSAQDVVPPGARLAAQTSLDDVRVLLTVDRTKLVTIVAFEGEKGWLGIDLEPVAGRTPAAWAATAGEDEVPAMSIVYGRPDGAAVSIRWADGRTARVETARDGAYVLARRGRVEVDRVTVLDGDGATLLEVTEL